MQFSFEYPALQSFHPIILYKSPYKDVCPIFLNNVASQQLIRKYQFCIFKSKIRSFLIIINLQMESIEYVYIYKSMPSLDYPIVIDFTSPKQIAAQLLQMTDFIRRAIQDRRLNIENQNKSFTYQVKTKGFTLEGIRGHHKLAKKKYSQAHHTAAIDSSNLGFIPFTEKVTTVRLTISTDHIYPQSIGYAFKGRLSDKQEQLKKLKEPQWFHIWINGEPYTMPWVNYSKPMGESSQLTDVLGILIAEQIRFNSLELILDYFPEIRDQQNFPPFYLYEFLYEKFISIYQNWQHKWGPINQKQQNEPTYQEELEKQLRRKAFKGLRENRRAIEKRKLEESTEKSFIGKNLPKGKTEEEIKALQEFEKYKQIEKIMNQMEDKGLLVFDNYQEFKGMQDSIKDTMIRQENVPEVKNKPLSPIAIIAQNQRKEAFEILLLNEKVKQFQPITVKYREYYRIFFVEKMIKKRS